MASPTASTSCYDQRRGGGQGEGARRHAEVFVDADGVILVDEVVLGERDFLFGDDVFDVEQVGEGAVEAGELRERRDAVVEQLGLRFDPAHIARVLRREEAVVAAHVLEIVEHPGVGVEGFASVWIEGGEAPEAGVLSQEVDDGGCVVQECWIDGGIEARAEGNDIHQQHDNRQQFPDRTASEAFWQVDGAARDAQHDARAGQEDRGGLQPREEIGVEGAVVGKGVGGEGE